MAIGGIQGSNYFPQINSLRGVNQPSGAGGDGDGDGSRSGAAGQVGGFASAISQALSQIGVTIPSSSSSSNSATSSSTSGSSSATGTPSATDTSAQQALGNFLQSLFAALQAQGQSLASLGSSNSSITGVHAGGRGHHHHGSGGAGQIQTELQSLIQQLTTASGTPGTSGTTGSSSATSALGAADTALQQSFQNLLTTTQGVTGSQANLTTFLQSLAQNMQSHGATGNLVSTQV